MGYILTDQDRDFVLRLAVSSAENVMRYFCKNTQIAYKQDDEFDPLTQADATTDQLIRSRLHQRFPADKILSEESSVRPTDFSALVWMVDPLDGTKEFVQGGDRFSIMIGLCEDGVPVFGVVVQPTSGDVYYAQKGKGAFVKRAGSTRRLKVRNINSIEEGLLLTSRTKGEPRQSETFLRSLPFTAFQEDSSFGLRAGLIAEGVADAFVATNTRASKWDVCAPHIILEEAGGKMTLSDGSHIDYKQAEAKIGRPFVGTAGFIHTRVCEMLTNMPV